MKKLIVTAGIVKSNPILFVMDIDRNGAIFKAQSKVYPAQIDG